MELVLKKKSLKNRISDFWFIIWLKFSEANVDALTYTVSNKSSGIIFADNIYKKNNFLLYYVTLLLKNFNLTLLREKWSKNLKVVGAIYVIGKSSKFYYDEN